MTSICTQEVPSIPAPVAGVYQFLATPAAPPVSDVAEQNLPALAPVYPHWEAVVGAATVAQAGHGRPSKFTPFVVEVDSELYVL